MKIQTSLCSLNAHAPAKDIVDWLHLWIAAPINGSEAQQQIKRLYAIHELSKVPQPCPSFGYRALTVDKDVETWEDLDKYLHGDFPESFAFKISGIEAFLSESPPSSKRQLIFKTRFQDSDVLANLVYLIRRLPSKYRQLPNDAGKTLEDHLAQQEIVTVSGTLKKALQHDNLWAVGFIEPGTNNIVQHQPRKSNIRV